MTVIGQFIDNERDTRRSPDIVAVPAQLNARLHRAESEGGHKLLLTPGECAVTQGIHIVPPTLPENPLHSVPHEMACVVIDGAPMASAQIEPQQSHPMCNKVHSWVPGSSEREPQRNRCECTTYSCSVPALSGAGSMPRALSVGPGTGIASCAWPLVRTNVGPTPLAHHSLSVSPRTERAGQLGPVGHDRKMSKTSVLQGSPHTKMVPTSPNSMPACPLQAPSTLSSRKAVPQQWDSKNVVNKWNELRISQYSPIPRMTLTSSGLYSPIWSHPLTVHEGDRILPKKGERWLASMAVSKNIISVPKCLPSFRAVPLLPGSRPTGSAQAASHSHHEMGLRASTLTVLCGNEPSSRDIDGEHMETTWTWPHASPLIMAVRSCGSSLTVWNWKANPPGRCSFLNIVSKEMMSTAPCLPCATASVQSESLPARLMWAASCWISM